MRNCSVHLFVFDGMADWEAAFAVAAIQDPRFQSNSGCFRITTAARFHAPIRCARDTVVAYRGTAFAARFRFQR